MLKKKIKKIMIMIKCVKSGSSWTATCLLSFPSNAKIFQNGKPIKMGNEMYLFDPYSAELGLSLIMKTNHLEKKWEMSWEHLGRARPGRVADQD